MLIIQIKVEKVIDITVNENRNPQSLSQSFYDRKMVRYRIDIGRLEYHRALPVNRRGETDGNRTGHSLL